ncbi:MAG: hypothetical protein KDB07_09365 [Planctomycetes bacterium]|nr:hypothetical protein [Planctomycetota bacterium]
MKTDAGTQADKTKVPEHVKHIDNFGDVGPSDKPEDNMVQRPAMPDEPMKTRERESADIFLSSIAKKVDVTTFCATPFLWDGREVISDLKMLQARFDEISAGNESGEQMFKISSFVSILASDAEESDSEALKTAAGNSRFAKVIAHAKGVGGSFGVMKIAELNPSDEIRVEMIVLAFDKEGKLIGSAD